MVKYFLLFAFLTVSSFSFADNDDAKAQMKIHAKMEAKLQKEYSRDLTKVPFFLRFAYYKEFSQEWGTTDYPQREAFLENYEKKTAAEQAKEKVEAKAEAVKEKAIAMEKKEELRKEKERLKAEAEKEKAEKRADEERQKQFDEALKEQKQELKQMQQQATQGN